jgi:hypothetical protein
VLCPEELSKAQSNGSFALQKHKLSVLPAGKAARKCADSLHLPYFPKFTGDFLLL